MTNDARGEEAHDVSGPSTPAAVTTLVIREFPDEALMRRRAYTQAVNRLKTLLRPAMLGPARKA